MPPWPQQGRRRPRSKWFRGLSCVENQQQKKSGQGLGLGGKQVNSLQQLRQFPIPTDLSFLQRGNAAETKRPPRGGPLELSI